MPAKPAIVEQPPPPPREFRGVWVATVGNIDWPSKPGLSTAQQQAEAIAILDRCSELNLNAVILQVRTSADALYESKLEPWSAFLTGTQGKAPSPYYDPLKFWIDQAHARGIELHAWFNPYRTKYAGGRVEAAESHISKAHPELVKSYGKMGWMDPGEPAAQAHSLAVFMDVVERYDVDGIHIDDYFYPYPERVKPDDETDKTEIPFPDEASYAKFKKAGGQSSLEDWRRHNINTLIEKIHKGIHERKPQVRFGISPFGIPRPGLKGIEYVAGFDQYDKLYADSEKWLKEGWCDYMAPQLYWKIGAPKQPFLGLLRWWTGHNPMGRNIYPGLFTSRIDWSENSWHPDEILGQITITRLTDGAGGDIQFSMTALSQNRKKVGDALRDGLYSQSAIPPTSRWLDNTPPAPPGEVHAIRAAAPAVVQKPDDAEMASATTGGTTRPFYPLSTQPAVDPKLQAVRVTWTASEGEPAWLWAVYYKQGSSWNFKTVPGAKREVTLRDSATNGATGTICVSAIDRCGNESQRVIISTGLADSGTTAAR
jgi:uncharacterized lipoprotein YddW (UPF0748 family)